MAVRPARDEVLEVLKTDNRLSVDAMGDEGVRGVSDADVEAEVLPPAADFEDFPDQEGEDETPGVKPLRAPEAPTQAEIDERNASHCPRRMWCRHCVKGSGKSDAHRQLEAEAEHRKPTISCDYCFMGEREDAEEMDSKCMPILVVKDHRS